MEIEFTNLGQPIAVGRTAEIYPWDGDRILKLFREWAPPDWVAYEARIAREVYLTGIPTPSVGDVIEVDGRHGIVYERVHGPSMLHILGKKPWRFIQYANMLAELHADMHDKKVAKLPASRERLETKIRVAKPLTEAMRNTALEALHRLPDGESLCHGDFHPDNILMTERGPVIIDWPDASCGHPLADVARTSLITQVADLPPETPARRIQQALVRRFHKLYLDRYFNIRPSAQNTLREWMLPVAAGRLSEDIPEERERVLSLIKTLMD